MVCKLPDGYYLINLTGYSYWNACPSSLETIREAIVNYSFKHVTTKVTLKINK